MMAVVRRIRSIMMADSTSNVPNHPVDLRDDGPTGSESGSADLDIK